MSAQDVGVSEKDGPQVADQDAPLAEAPALYANGFAVVGQAYGIQFIFTMRNGPSEQTRTVANIHVSPQLAKVVGRLIRQNVRSFEEKMGGPIVLPDQLLEQLNVRDFEE